MFLWRSARACLIAAAFSALPAPCALSPRAEPGGLHAEIFAQRLAGDTGRNVFFVSADLAGKSRFVGFGSKHALGGRLDDAGFRFMSTIGVKLRDVDPGTGLRSNRIDLTRAFAGYEWKRAATSLTGFVGASIALNTASAASLSRRAARFGPAVALDLWHDWPRDAPLGARATSLFLLADHATRSVYGRLRHAFAIPGSSLRIGPEIAVSRGRSIVRRGVSLQSGWRQLRLGLHLAEIPVWRFRLTLSGGVEYRERNGRGGYAQIASHIRY